MTGRPMHRTQAVRLLRIAQGGTVVVALVAFSVLAVDLPGTGRPAEAPPTLMPVTLPDRERTTQETAKFRIDAKDISESFGLLANAPRPTPPASTGEGEEEEVAARPETPPAGEEETELRYIASITGGGVEVAIIRVGDRQVWLSAGREIEGVKLVEVEPDSALVDFRGQTQRLRPGDRFGPAVSFSGGGAAGTDQARRPAGSAAAPTEGGRPGTTRRPTVTEPQKDSDEELQREAESRGVDPETLRRERARQSAEELRRRQQEQRNRARRTREAGSN
ncbi:MAG: hypothetical protein JJU33_08790 [Phycisphaerales bacterium]|nr:hypothetical protein [Phycisphaerales bacterium]